LAALMPTAYRGRFTIPLLRAWPLEFRSRFKRRHAQKSPSTSRREL